MFLFVVWAGIFFQGLFQLLPSKHLIVQQSQQKKH